MKILLLAVLCAILVPVNMPSVQAAQVVHGWYELGASVIDDASLESFGLVPVSGNEVQFDPGFRFGIGMGAELTRFLRLEVESGFHYNSIDKITGATASQGNLYQIPLMGNVVLQFPNRTGIIPVVGAGVGAFYSILDSDGITLGGATLVGTEETWGFAYQGFAGLRYDFRQDMGLGVFYRYMVSDGPSWELGGGAVPDFKLDQVRSHNLSIALNFKF
jgi:opacity protein-like surface antigen